MVFYVVNFDFYVNFKQGFGYIWNMEVVLKFKLNVEWIKVIKCYWCNVMDLFSVVFMLVCNVKDSLGFKVCVCKLLIFDGWICFDVKLSYQGIKEVFGCGYDGFVVVCKVKWVLVVGYWLFKVFVKYMVKVLIEFWLVLIGWDNVLIFYCIFMQMKNGKLVVQVFKLIIDGKGSDWVFRQVWLVWFW